LVPFSAKSLVVETIPSLAALAISVVFSKTGAIIYLVDSKAVVAPVSFIFSETTAWVEAATDLVDAQP
jgi:hypothetical protein